MIEISTENEKPLNAKKKSSHLGQLDSIFISKLRVEDDLTWSDEKFIYIIRENPDKTNIQQILTKTFNLSYYRKQLERRSTFYVLADIYVYQSIN